MPPNTVVAAIGILHGVAEQDGSLTGSSLATAFTLAFRAALRMLLESEIRPLPLSPSLVLFASE